MRPPWTRSWPDGAKSQTTSSAAMKYSRIAAGTGGTAMTDPKARRIQSAACFIIDIDLHFQQAAAIALLSDRWDFVRSMGTAARVTPLRSNHRPPAGARHLPRRCDRRDRGGPPRRHGAAPWRRDGRMLG